MESNIESNEGENIHYPVLSSLVYYKGNIIVSDIKEIIINPFIGSLNARGKDQYGEFNLIGKFSNTKCNSEIQIRKVYDNQQIDFNLNMRNNYLEGVWKTNVDSLYDPSNKVEIILNLQEFELIIELEEGRGSLNKKIFTNYLNDDNLQEYVGLSCFNNNDKIEFIDAGVYDITHVIYQHLLYNKSKNYFSGQFDLENMRFVLKKTELI